MIRLAMTSPERGDCTAGYAVRWTGEYTVRSFVDEILKTYPGDWGYIGIYVPVGKRNSFSDAVHGNPYCEYSDGKFVNTLPEDVLNRKVYGASADGGWSRMDYMLSLNETDGEE